MPTPSQRRIDISKLSGVGLSHNWGGFEAGTVQYLENFTATFEGVPLRPHAIDWDAEG